MKPFPICEFADSECASDRLGSVEQGYHKGSQGNVVTGSSPMSYVGFVNEF